MKMMVPPLTLTVVSLSNFRDEVLRSKDAVLVAFLHQGLGYKQQLEVVEHIAVSYGPALKVCVAAAEDLEVFSRMHQMTGTPAFLLFRQGKEQGRLLGESDEEWLLAFIDRSLYVTACQVPSLAERKERGAGKAYRLGRG